MDNKKLDYFRKKLMTEKRKTLVALNNMNNMKEFGAIDAYYTELSNYDNHPADIGTELFMMEQDNGFKNKRKDVLLEIEDSFKDIEDGSYGICKDCNKKISEERLELIPYLKTCIDCAGEREIFTEDFIDRRRIVPDDEVGEAFKDTRADMIMFDREDSYQKVAAYNYIEDDPSRQTGDFLGVMDEEDNDGGDGVEFVENISQEYYDETLK